MSASADDLFSLLYQARTMENNVAKCAVLEELIRKADVRQDVEVGFEARMTLVEAATFSGALDAALVAFSWCLSQADKDPDRFSGHDLLWKHKWVTESLVDFPHFSKKQIDDMLADMQARHERAGSGPYPVTMLRWTMAMAMGDKAGARKWHARLHRTPRGFLSDCPACVQDHEVEYAIFVGKDEKAIALAEPIVAGRLYCAHVPHRTYGRLLMPLLRRNRLAEAAVMHRTGYRLAAQSSNLLRTIAHHLLFLALTGNLARAVKLFEKHLSWLLDVADFLARFDFLFASRFLMERLARADTKALKIRLPRAFPLFRQKGGYEVVDLHVWLTTEAAELAQRFDDRNGNDYFATRLRGMKKLHTLATPYPLG